MTRHRADSTRFTGQCSSIVLVINSKLTYTLSLQIECFFFGTKKIRCYENLSPNDKPVYQPSPLEVGLHTPELPLNNLTKLQPLWSLHVRCQCSLDYHSDKKPNRKLSYQGFRLGNQLIFQIIAPFHQQINSSSLKVNRSSCFPIDNKSVFEALCRHISKMIIYTIARNQRTIGNCPPSVHRSVGLAFTLTNQILATLIDVLSNCLSLLYFRSIVIDNPQDCTRTIYAITFLNRWFSDAVASAGTELRPHYDTFHALGLSHHIYKFETGRFFRASHDNNQYDHDN